MSGNSRCTSFRGVQRWFAPACGAMRSISSGLTATWRWPIAGGRAAAITSYLDAPAMFDPEALARISTTAGTSFPPSGIYLYFNGNLVHDSRVQYLVIFFQLIGNVLDPANLRTSGTASTSMLRPASGSRTAGGTYHHMKDVSMNLAIAMLVVASALAATAAPARAQQLAPAPLPSVEQRSEELSTWLKQDRAWEKWFELWGTGLRTTATTSRIWDRKKRPEPPVWLAAVCRDEVMVDEQLASACNILWSWDEQPLQIIRRRGSQVATTPGKPRTQSSKRRSFSEST